MKDHNKIYYLLFPLLFFFIQILPNFAFAEEKLIHGFDPGGISDIYILYAILIGVILFMFILVKPVYGIAFNIIFYPFLKVSAGISIMELMSAAIIYAFIGGWIAWTVIHRYHPDRDYLNCEKTFLLFNVYLIVNGVTAYIRHIPVINIIRDMVPLANLFMFPIVKAFVRNEKDLNFLVIVQIIIASVLLFKQVVVMITNNALFASFPASVGNLQVIFLSIASVGGIVFFSNKRLWTILSLFSFTYLLLTANRTIFLSAIGCLALMIFMLRRSRHVVYMTMGTVMLSILLYSTVSFLKAPVLEAKKERFTQAISGHQLSLLNRLDEIKHTGNLFIENPIMGVGVGHWYRFWRHFIKGKGPGYVKDNFTHSDLMNFLAKLGIIGTLIFYVFYYKVCKLAWLIWKLAESPKERGKGLMCFTLLIAAFVVGQSTPIIQSRPSALFLGLIMGYTFCYYRIILDKKLET